MNIAPEKPDGGLSTGARDELRLRVLRALAANPMLNQRQIASELGVSLGGVNYALKALVMGCGPIFRSYKGRVFVCGLKGTLRRHR